MSMPKEDQVIVVQGNVPAFLLKLWKIVEDHRYDHLISWSKNGRAFKVHDQIEFAKEILPRFYKHNNFSSFVRQVNMYGFRKIVDPNSGSLKLDRDEWEFLHHNFQQSKPDQLHLIKRKVHKKEDFKTSNPQMINLLQDVERLKNQAEAVNSRLDLVKAENELLWREVSDLRETHQNQQTVINKLIQFFIQLVMTKGDISRKRRALDYPFVETKFTKTQELQPYDANNTALSQLLQDPTYTVESPIEDDDRVIELPPDADIPTINNDILDKEGASPSSELTSDVMAPDLLSDSLNDGQTDETSFIFPEVYNPSASRNIMSSDTLTTPTVTIPEVTPTTKPPSNYVVSMSPTIARQHSFNDRQEISEDVDKISKSINILQDMLKKKQINLDLSSLEIPAFNELMSQVSVQDLIRLSQNESEEELLAVGNSSHSTSIEHGNGAETEGQVIPYTAPFSPSQLMDSEYATAGSAAPKSDFFDNVFEQS